MAKHTEKAPGEADLLKALDELEKGAIPNEMKNPNGGLATEGESIDASVDEHVEPKAGKVSKADDDSESDESESMSDDSESEGADDESSEEAPPKPPMKAKKSETADDETSEHESEDLTTKSFREAAEEDENISKAIEVSGFMESLVGRTGDSIDFLRKSIDELGEVQQGFNGKVKKALVAMGNQTLENTRLLKALVDKLQATPAPRREGKALLSKSEIHERFEDSDGLDHSKPEVRQMVSQWLVQKAVSNEIPASWVTTYESGIGQLPPDLLKACETDLRKSSS